MAKVKIQGHASGTGILTVTAPNTSTDRTITLPDSTGTLVDNTTAVTKDASGNVGIGVTPETDIPSLYKALQINGAGSIYAKESGTDCRLHLSSNASMNSSYDDKYIKSSVNSSTYIQSAGTHTFQTAASGSADGTISWTTGFEVLNDGKARAKNGLLFGTDTAAANTLDDYEEGTWTPTIVNGGTITTVNAAVYTKVGNVVSFQLYANNISITNNASTFEIGGLPFQPMNSPNTYGGGEVGYVGGFNWAQYAPSFLVNPGGSKIYWQRLNGTSTVVTQANVQGLTVIILSGVYHTNS